MVAVRLVSRFVHLLRSTVGYLLGLRFHVHSQSTDFPPPLGRHKTLPEFANISFNLPENDLFLHSNSSAEAFRTAENNSKMFCPVGQCVGGSTKPVKASFCLNAHPVYDLNCMAKVRGAFLRY